MQKLEKEKRGIKFIIKIQFSILAIIITAGGIIHGINTGKWSNVFETVIALLAITSVFARLSYLAAVNRHEKYL